MFKDIDGKEFADGDLLLYMEASGAVLIAQVYQVTDDRKVMCEFWYNVLWGTLAATDQHYPLNQICNDNKVNRVYKLDMENLVKHAHIIDAMEQNEALERQKAIEEGETLEIRGRDYEVKDVKTNGRVILKIIKPTKHETRKKRELAEAEALKKKEEEEIKAATDQANFESEQEILLETQLLLHGAAIKEKGRVIDPDEATICIRQLGSDKIIEKSLRTFLLHGKVLESVKKPQKTPGKPENVQSTSILDEKPDFDAFELLSPEDKRDAFLEMTLYGNAFMEITTKEGEKPTARLIKKKSLQIAKRTP